MGRDFVLEFGLFVTFGSSEKLLNELEDVCL